MQRKIFITDEKDSEDTEYQIGDEVVFRITARGDTADYMGTVDDIDFKDGKVVYYIASGDNIKVVSEDDIIDYA